MLDKHRAPVAPRTPDFWNWDVCCHHTESNALPTELRDRCGFTDLCFCDRYRYQFYVHVRSRINDVINLTYDVIVVTRIIYEHYTPVAYPAYGHSGHALYLWLWGAHAVFGLPTKETSHKMQIAIGTMYIHIRGVFNKFAARPWRSIDRKMT